MQFQALLDSFFYRPDEPTPPLLEWADEAALPHFEVEDPPREVLVFSLEQETYAVPIELVREIVKVPVLTEVPRAKPGLLGVMNLRGEVLPVYDVKVRLKLAESSPVVTRPSDVPREARVILLRDELGDAGLLVDSVAEVVRLPESTIEPAPPGGAEPLCIQGVARQGEKLVILLDVPRLLP